MRKAKTGLQKFCKCVNNETEIFRSITLYLVKGNSNIGMILSDNYYYSVEVTPIRLGSNIQAPAGWGVTAQLFSDPSRDALVGPGPNSH